MGWFGFLVFYLASGIAAAFAHVYSAPGSTVPTVGASGAVLIYDDGSAESKIIVSGTPKRRYPA